MEFTATAKYIRMSTRKMRLMAESVRSMKPVEAIDALAVSPKSAALPLRKVIESALANARSKDAQVDRLTFKVIEVMGGPAMRRFRAVSRGRAHGYKRRMTHVRVVLHEGNSIETSKVQNEKKGS